MTQIIFFFGHLDRYGDKKYLSNFYPVNFTDGNITYNSNEQYMMYHKALLFNDEEIAKKILETKDPKKIKRLGRLVKNFDEKIWNEHAENIVHKGAYLKFSQNEELKKYLISTNKAILVESSPYDKKWGIGMTAKDAKNIPSFWFTSAEQKPKEDKRIGNNLLGKILMEVRNEINLNID